MKHRRHAGNAFVSFTVPAALKRHFAKDASSGLLRIKTKATKGCTVHLVNLVSAASGIQALRDLSVDLEEKAVSRIRRIRVGDYEVTLKSLLEFKKASDDDEASVGLIDPVYVSQLLSEVDQHIDTADVSSPTDDESS